MMLFRTLSLTVLLLSLPAAHADELGDIFLKLPGSCFEKWGENGPPPIATPANRTRLVQAAPGDIEKCAAELGLRNVVIDHQHGFITFGSNTDGEGDVFTLSFWKCDDGTRLVGITIDHWSTSTSDTSHVSFWRKAGERMLDVTDSFLPVIPLTKFFDRHPDAVKAAAADGFHWRWLLPQRGTTIRVEAPSLQLLDEYAVLGEPDHAYEGHWDGKGFTWARVDPKK